jgi:hypothetical protein
MALFDTNRSTISLQYDIILSEAEMIQQVCKQVTPQS